MTGGSAAVQGIQMLNPQRWAGSGNMGRDSGAGAYSRKMEDGGMLFEIEDEDDEERKGSTAAGDENGVLLRSCSLYLLTPFLTT